MRILDKIFGVQTDDDSAARHMCRDTLNDLFHAEFRAHSFVGARVKTERRPLFLRPVPQKSGREYIVKACRNRIKAVSGLAVRKARYSNRPLRIPAGLAVAGGAAQM